MRLRFLNLHIPSITFHLSLFYFSSLLCSITVEAADANNDVAEGGASDDASYQGTSTVAADEWYMLLSLSLMFGYCITLLGTGILSFSVHEDALMRRYRDEGEVVRGNVMTAAVVRGGGQVECCSKAKAKPAFIAFVEYNRNMTKDYAVRIRKQVKVSQVDFIEPVRIGTIRIEVEVEGGASPSDENNFYLLNDSTQMCLTMTSDFPDAFIPGQQGSLSENLFVPEHHYIELLVLPGYVRSAYPKNSVKRACSFQSRLTTLILISVFVVLVAFLTGLASKAVIDMDDERQKSIGWFAIGSLLVLIVLEVPLIHFCLNDFFAGALRAEYLELGDFVPLHGGSSSLSSANSDSFLTSPINMSAVSLL